MKQKSKVLFYFVLLYIFIPTFVWTDTGEDNDHSLSAEVKLFYYSIDRELSQYDAYTTALGGYVDYLSPTYHNLQANIRFYTSNPIGSDKNRETTLLYKLNGDSLSSLAVANVAYNYKSTKVKIGRQRLFTPMANDDTTRIIPYVYTGITISNRSVENLHLQAGYIHDLKPIISDDFRQLSPAGEIEKGFYYLGANAKLPWQLNSQAFFYYAYELYDAIHLQLERTFNVDEWQLDVGAQYIKTATNGTGKNLIVKSNSGSDDVSLWAYKVALTYKDLTLSHALSINEGEGGIVRGYGGYTKVYTSSMYETAKSKGGAKGLNFTLKYNINDSLQFESIYLKTTYDAPEANPYVSIYGGLKYYYQDKSYVHLRYEHVDRKTALTDGNYFRVITTYRF